MSSSFTSQDRYSTAAQEDRSAPRTRISIPASLRPSGGRSFQTVVQDLSLSGFSAMAINRLNPGTLCWLTLPNMESMEAEVIWWNNSLVGCAFHQLLNPIIHDNILAQWRSGNGIFRSIM
ncbi:PilZ domain-containing protein [Novosphingobium sp. G106]|uniref:PilZ domain-containing protein n=1 Tax=Novosphingobium sp. G106 TaxID=2849500 RepID=UPI001C2DD2A1|nr:PilZ domain-containing protein [Novosphingobium sp. G106]MBV1686933.1 PilZ domain-containing protein [Novosphingobium sp. G106]